MFQTVSGRQNENGNCKLPEKWLVGVMERQPQEFDLGFFSTQKGPGFQLSNLGKLIHPR